MNFEKHNEMLTASLEDPTEITAAALVIQYVVWAVANRPLETMKATYGNCHVLHYYDEKIERSNSNFIGWFGELGYMNRAALVRFAIETYATKEG